MSNVKFLISLFSFLLIGVAFLDAVPQKIVLYKDANCLTSSDDDHLDVTDETTVIDATGFEGAKSVLVTGVWEVILKNSANQDVRHLLHQQPDNTNCTNTQDFADTGHTFRQITRIGLEEIDNNALVLATELQLGGERFIARGRWNLDWPVNIKSVALFETSRKFNVYGYADYAGFAACIASDDPTKKLFVADMERTLQAQSAKPDTSGNCPTNEIILPPPGEITSPVPTTTTTPPQPSTSLSPASSTLPPASSTLPPASSTLPPASSTLPPASSTLPPASSTLPPASSTLPPASTTLPPASSTLPPASSTLPPASSTLPPASTSDPSVSTPPPASPTSPISTLSTDPSAPSSDSTGSSNEPTETTTGKGGGVSVHASLLSIILLTVAAMNVSKYF